MPLRDMQRDGELRYVQTSYHLISSFSVYVVLLHYSGCNPFLSRWAAMTSISSLVSKTAAATSAAPSASSTQRATPQAGILEGGNPSVYDPKNPIFLFIIQVR